ncbi:MAG: uracil-DNA glycosylase [Hyphomonas sp.]|uniref:uracil-DNA glycosylase n=1 Tax=Hyphomonas sp. TaxID=87 RepID=UPI0017D9665C|nr:uracil-DNA glycosylase [Hyphomonas sp.]MBA3069562.1 uracil-DNA glycosylase [Hyphomonas sp.]MBU3922526.1 uracil-DNA glycosylase [Alphaproteobacteria bacterium]MBU4063277.1 uracil-DNA glycosylase [Alphaproteobacteria bacterium]MBU4164095.1 uracil-DNA glycosylase [Alphaproteobacteria bacterium]
MKPDTKTPPEAPRDCPLCPRLVAYRDAVRAKEPTWFNGAVPSFGSDTAELVIVGLAPGVTGANRTGRPFTGDWAGDLLYATLDKFGFSKGTYAADPGDGLQLTRAMITNAVRCVPPENKPVGEEINTCRPFLKSRLAALPKLKVMICLGKISHDSTIRALGLKLAAHPFGHATRYEVSVNGRPVTLLSSYHCSRYNTNTGRLTAEMFEDVFSMAKEALG